jgi:hypothetical protein
VLLFIHAQIIKQVFAGIANASSHLRIAMATFNSGFCAARAFNGTQRIWKQCSRVHMPGGNICLRHFNKGCVNGMWNIEAMDSNLVAPTGLAAALSPIGQPRPEQPALEWRGIQVRLALCNAPWYPQVSAPLEPPRKSRSDRAIIRRTWRRQHMKENISHRTLQRLSGQLECALSSRLLEKQQTQWHRSASSARPTAQSLGAYRMLARLCRVLLVNCV